MSSKSTFKIIYLGGYVLRIVFFKLSNNEDKNVKKITVHIEQIWTVNTSHMSQMIPKNMSPRYYILSSTTINCRSLPLKLFFFCNDFPKLRSFSYRKIEKYTIEYKTFPYSTIGVSTPQNGPFRFSRFDCYWIQTYKQIESPNLDNMRKVYNVNINITCFFPFHIT